MPLRLFPTPRLIWTAALALAIVLPAYGIKPGRWTHTNEADFQAGKVEGTVVSNLGDVKLAAATTTLDEMPEGVTLIYDIQTVGGVTYLAAGPEGKLLKVEDDKAVEVAAFANEQVFTLAALGDQLLIGISGNKARLAALRDDQVIDLVALDDARFIWDILPMGQDVLLATGPEGVIYRLTDVAAVAEGLVAGEPIEPAAPVVLLDTAQANVLCLAAGQGGVVYAGTDTEGLIYRIDARGNAFVVYDAAEPEVGTLLVTADGMLYAGTADANQARPGRLTQPVSEEKGKPEQPDAPEAPEDEAPEEGEAEPQEAEQAEAPAPEPATEEPEAPAPKPEPKPEAAAEDTTPAQRDALRELIRQRLLAARKAGKITPTTPTAAGQPRATRSATAASTGNNTGGNAVYRIDPQGFVTPVFRESVVIFKLAAVPLENDVDGYALLIATGPEGQLYHVDPNTGETAVLLDLEASNIPALELTPDGKVVLGTADAGTLVTLEPGVTKRGVFTSAVLDAAQISLFGTFNLTASVPPGGSILVETRSGNVQDPEIAAWSAWSEAQVFMPDGDRSPLQPREITITSPPARFLQYRLTLTSDGQASPSVGRVELAYVMPNRRPQIASIKARYPDTRPDQPPTTTMNIEWEATDANGDRLLYHVEFQPAGSERWLTLASDLTDANFAWNTTKAPDGRYLLRVTASDRLDNPGDMAMTASRRSDPVLVDNTPPAVENLEIKVQGRSVTLSGLAVDALSTITAISYTLNDAELETPLLPTDLIFDSTRESFVATIADLSPGSHVVTLRVTDARGNTTHRPAIFEIE